MREIPSQISEYFHQLVGAEFSSICFGDYDDAVSAKDRLEGVVDAWATYSGSCQSPIEQRLLAAMLFARNGWDHLRAVHHDEPHDVPEFGTLIHPQFPVGSYIVDFMAITYFDGAPAFYVAIECDGHNFHERTKEQAAHDRSRDRILTASGILVMRFTGSQIHRDAGACAEEITNLLADRIQRLIDIKVGRAA